MSEKLKGSQIVIKSLEKLGVEIVFAYTGGQALELNQAISHSHIRVVVPRHEQGGAFAAGGYARSSGKVGVCMATSGPGATNLISGIADAYMDSIPTLFITGQVPSHLIGKNAFQETDIIGVTRPIVKHNFLVLDAKDLPRTLKEAYYLANSGRPGPVLVDIPKNVQQQICEVDFDVEMQLNNYIAEPKATVETIDKMREMISQAKRPCVYAGGGIISSGASEVFRKFLELYNLPAVTTLMGIGALPHDHKLSLGWLGMHGNVTANYAANECDLLIALGARFSDRVTGTPATFAAGAKIIHVDIDVSEINKNKIATLGVVGNVADVLAQLCEKSECQDYTEWFAQLDKWKKEFPLTYKKRDDVLQPQFVVETLSRLTDGKAMIVPGVGQHQMWAAQYYKYSAPRQFLTSGGLGAMGFGLPAAMGAKLACPDTLVINIDGDGSFQMNIQELGTLFVEEIGVKMIILDNQHLGMVTQWEDRFYQGNRGNTVLGRAKGGVGSECGNDCKNCSTSNCFENPYPNFVKISEGYEIPARLVRTAEELEEAIKEMLNTSGPFLIDVLTGHTEHVLPMIPPGGSYKSIITE